MPINKENRLSEATRRREAGLVPVTVWVPAERKAELMLLAQKMSRGTLPPLPPSDIPAPSPKIAPPPPLPRAVFTPPPPLPPLPSAQEPLAAESPRVDEKTEDITKREAILRGEAAKMEKLSRMRKLAGQLRKKALVDE